MEISKAIRESQFFIALLSEQSTTQKGYVHTELRKALDVMSQFPDGEVFIIPVRLDDCKMNNFTLQNKQWVDMFPDWQEGLERILRTINQSQYK